MRYLNNNDVKKYREQNKGDDDYVTLDIIYYRL